MSYGPPPKTAYGDQDFIKEDFVPTGQIGISPPTNYGAISSYPGPPRESYNQSTAYGQPTAGNQSTAPNYSPNANQNPLLVATQSMTQEDLIFMKSWRQDTMYYKVFPLTLITNGANFLYNRKQGLPHKPLRYGLITVASYFCGVWLSRGDLKRRVQDSALNTPFMQAMKKMSGASGFMSEFQATTMEPLSGWNTSVDGFNVRPYPPPPHTAYPDQPTPGIYNQPDANYHSGPAGRVANSDVLQPYSSTDGDLPTKQTTSYEELRARNRGFLPPKQV